MQPLTSYSISRLQEMFARGTVGPVEVVRAYLDEIDSKEGAVRAFIETSPDQAIERAKRLERLDPKEYPLYGVPVAIKDNICTSHLHTTCASKILAGYTPPYDATAVSRLLDAGAVLMGKTNLDEFAMGSSTENSAFKITRNPWNTDCTPGGSSGGSAAAVAAGMVPVALGSDTGGSIRQPAAFCGVVGMKGSYGRVSRYGLVAFASSFDQIGPVTRDVMDCAIVMKVISGHDAMDSTTLPGNGNDMLGSIDKGIAGLKVAIPAGMSGWGMDEDVRHSMDDTVKFLETSGARVSQVELPDMDVSMACYYVLANAEASSNLARFDGVKYGYRAEAATLSGMYRASRGEGFGEEVKRRILLGTYVLSSGYYDAYYLKAQNVRKMIRARFQDVFDEIDIIAMPTTPTPAFGIGEKVDDPVAMYMSDIFTTGANIAGIPAISIPAGLSREGLPIGMQLIAGAGREALLLGAAGALEKNCRFRERCLPDPRRWGV